MSFSAIYMNKWLFWYNTILYVKCHTWFCNKLWESLFCTAHWLHDFEFHGIHFDTTDKSNNTLNLNKLHVKSVNLLLNDKNLLFSIVYIKQTEFFYRAPPEYRSEKLNKKLWRPSWGQPKGKLQDPKGRSPCSRACSYKSYGENAFFLQNFFPIY